MGFLTSVSPETAVCIPTEDTVGPKLPIVASGDSLLAHVIWRLVEDFRHEEFHLAELSSDECATTIDHAEFFHPESTADAISMAVDQLKVPWRFFPGIERKADFAAAIEEKTGVA